MKYESSEIEEPHARMISVGSLLISLIALTLLSVRLFDTPVLLSANDRSRWCTVWSLVEQRTYKIDDIRVKPGWDTIDKVYHEGHYYSSKPPFLAVLVAPIYWAVKATTGMSLLRETQTCGHMILWLIKIVPLGFAFWYWAALLHRLKLPASTTLLLQSIFCFGTLMLPFATTLNNHLPGAMALLFSVYFFITTEPSTPRIWNLVWCGFWAGMTFAFELPAASYVLLLGLLLLRDAPRQTLLAYAPASLLVIAIYLGLNVVATGGIKPFYSYYGTEKYLHEVAGIPSYWAEPKGVDRAPDSFPVYLLHCTLGHHGIFSLTPVWLLLLPAWMQLRRVKEPRLWQASLLSGVITCIVFAFYMTRTDHYNFGGVTVALRWLVWLIPLWMVSIAIWLKNASINRSMFTLILVLLVPSIVSAWSPWIGPWRHPWIFQVMDQAGWIDQYREQVVPFEQPLRTWFARLPQDAAELPYWAEFRSVDIDGEISTFRIEVTQIGSERIDLTYRDDAGASGDFSVSKAGFDSGLPLSEMLFTNDGDDHESVVTFVRGFLARPDDQTAYRPGFDRFLKLPFQKDYLRCQRAAAEVTLKLPNSGIWVTSKSDLWLNNDVPFGTAQFVTTLTELTTGETIARRQWTLLDHSGLTPSDEPSEQ